MYRTRGVYRLFMVLICVGLAKAVPVAAEPAPFPEFTFKRVTPPKPGSAPKVDVQIGPVVPAARAAPAADAAGDGGAPAAALRYPWFWDLISPDIDQASPARIEDALRALRSPDDTATVPMPRLQPLRDLAQEFGTTIMAATIDTGVSPALALAVVWVESSGRADAVSSAGAQGLMQLMPDTATRFGVDDSLVPHQNIQGGIAFLDLLLKTFQGDPVLALAGYNAGENAVLRAQGVPDYPETRDYVPKVLAAYSIARGLCMTPPQFVSDGCVFGFGASN